VNIIRVKRGGKSPLWLSDYVIMKAIESKNTQTVNDGYSKYAIPRRTPAGDPEPAQPGWPRLRL
jgi:hypothetical protein